MSETLTSIFANQVEQSGRRVALRYRSGGIWRGLTWQDWNRRSSAIAACLCDWGIAAGDRVAILSTTRICWVEADVGILLAGAATVPIYSTLRPSTIASILADSGAKGLFVQDPHLLSGLVAEEPDALLELDWIVMFDRVSRLQRPDREGRLDVSIEDVAVGEQPLHSLESMVEEGEAILLERPELVQKRGEAVTPDTLAAVYYTSGTGGEPKGVMLTHDNFVYETLCLRDLIPISFRDEQLLFLPLAHIMAKLTVMLQLRVGFVTSFAHDMEEAAEDCAQIRPTFLLGVPRVFEKIQEAVVENAHETGARRKVFDWALGVGAQVSETRLSGRELSTKLTLAERAAERLVFSKIAERLGGRIRFMLSGAAPLSKDTCTFFHSIGLLILEGYGLTETCGASSLNLPHRFRFGTVGQPLPQLEMKLADDGEVLVRGRSVTPGYWQDVEENERAFDEDGFFRTGDVGSIEDGYLTITDRKKDLIITAGGKNIAPQYIEQRLAKSPFISRAVVLGDRRKFAVALIIPDGEAVEAWAKEEELTSEEAALIRHPRLRALLAAEIEMVNESLANYERVKRFEPLNRGLSLERGELTPTGKLRRRVVAEHFAELVDGLYEGLTAEVEEDIG